MSDENTTNTESHVLDGKAAAVQSQKNPDGVAAIDDATQTITAEAVSTRTIMVAEDDMFISDIYDVKLTSAGYNVVIANNGRDAIEKLRSGIRPHLLLLDIVMPYMDGFDVLDAMSGNPEWKKIPVVLLTNLSQKEDIDRAMENGAKDYLIKSHFTPSEVLSKVEKYIIRD
jgi:CheY-like chemotaxis protein